MHTTQQAPVSAKSLEKLEAPIEKIDPGQEPGTLAQSILLLVLRALWAIYLLPLGDLPAEIDNPQIPAVIRAMLRRAHAARAAQAPAPLPRKPGLRPSQRPSQARPQPHPHPPAPLPRPFFSSA